jgi:hypothetical protein
LGAALDPKPPGHRLIRRRNRRHLHLTIRQGSGKVRLSAHQHAKKGRVRLCPRNRTMPVGWGSRHRRPQRLQ